MASEISKAIDQICDEKHIPRESVIEAIESALAVAYRKEFGNKTQNVVVEFNADTGGMHAFDVKEVVEDPPPPPEEPAEGEGETSTETEEPKAKVTGPEAEAQEKPSEASAGETPTTQEPEKPVFDPKIMIGLTAAQDIQSGAKIGDVLKTELPITGEFGRMAAQTAKQVIIQKLRESERDILFAQFKEKEGKIVSGVVQRREGRVVLVDLGNTAGILPSHEQSPAEHYTPGQRLKVYIVSVNRTAKGPEILVSRSHPQMVAELFALEVPEIESEAIEIKAVAREAGLRSKIALISHEPNIDPVGSCVGQRGARVQTVISELGGEKIDIIEYDEDPVRFIINALSPAKVISVQLKEEEHTAIAEVREDQLSLAIGKAGQNVRLAARLTGWRIDVVKEGEEPGKREQKKEEQEQKKVAAEETPIESAPAEESPEKKIEAEEPAVQMTATEATPEETPSVDVAASSEPKSSIEIKS